MAQSKLAAQLEEVEQRLVSIGGSIGAVNTAVTGASLTDGTGGGGGGGGSSQQSPPPPPPPAGPTEIRIRHDHQVRVDDSGGWTRQDRQPAIPPGTIFGAGGEVISSGQPIPPPLGRVGLGTISTSSSGGSRNSGRESSGKFTSFSPLFSQERSRKLQAAASWRGIPMTVVGNMTTEQQDDLIAMWEAAGSPGAATGSGLSGGRGAVGLQASGSGSFYPPEKGSSSSSSISSGPTPTQLLGAITESVRSSSKDSSHLESIAQDIKAIRSESATASLMLRTTGAV